MKLLLVLGTRPQIIKSVPIIAECEKRNEVDLEIIHTGQHYDFEMSNIFIKELKIGRPFHNLNIGSGSHGWQTGMMLIELERFMTEKRPDWVVVPGDTNSTIAGALTAVKLNMRLAHVESGARSFDMTMPEEVNRKLTDHCSEALFTVTKNHERNLLKEGISADKIHQVGDTMYDLVLTQMSKIERSSILKQIKLEKEKYAVFTLHRQENVDNVEKLKQIIDGITSIKEILLIFPVHPRTKRRLESLNLYIELESLDSIRLIPPLGYHDMLKLLKNAKLLLTDSGGLQKEAFWLKTRCITLRDSTEWTETIDAGVNTLVGANKSLIQKEIKRALNSDLDVTRYRTNPYGDGEAAKKIVSILERI